MKVITKKNEFLQKNKFLKCILQISFAYAIMPVGKRNQNKIQHKIPGAGTPGIFITLG